MSRLPSCTAAQVIRALKRAGFVFDHATGSHQDCFSQQLEPVEEAPTPSSSWPRKACARKSVGRTSMWGGAYAARWISAFETVDKQMCPSIRREKNAATRGGRSKTSPKRSENPLSPSRPRFLRGRIEGLAARESTVSFAGMRNGARHNFLCNAPPDEFIKFLRG